MKIDDTFYLGIISKKFGFKGELTGIFDVDDPGKYTKLESVFLLIGEKLVPFFIDNLSFRPKSNQAIIKFANIDSEHEAEGIINCKMYLPLELLPPLSGNQFYFHEVEGFDVFDSKHGYIGKVKCVLDYPGNPIFQIMKDLTEILIPVKDEYVENLDRESRRINIVTPDGLVDIYLKSDS